MTATLLAVGVGLAGLVIGLRIRQRRYLLVREQLRDATQRISAWKIADTKGDLDVVGPVARKVEQFDQDADPLRPVQVVPLPPPPCADGGLCAYVVAGMAGCDEECAVSLADDDEARLFLRDVREQEHLGQPCGWSEDGTTTCGGPAEGWARWPDGEPTWLCATHMAWMRSQAEDDPGRID